MTNEEKARAIIGEDCKRENCLECGGRYSAEEGGCATYQKIMQMAEWKEQQMIEKALAYLNNKFYFNNLFYGVVSTDFNSMEEMFEDFKQVMKGE